MNFYQDKEFIILILSFISVLFITGCSQYSTKEVKNEQRPQKILFPRNDK